MTEVAQKSETGLKIDSEGSGKNPVISLGAEFDAAVVQGRGFKIELAADGSVIVYTDGTVRVKPAPANEDVKKAALKIGDLDDGGISSLLFADNLEFWSSVVARFEKHIGFR